MMRRDGQEIDAIFPQDSSFNSTLRFGQSTGGGLWEFGWIGMVNNCWTDDDGVLRSR